MKIQSKFLTRAAGLPRGSMMTDFGTIKSGFDSLIVETPHGVWTMSFPPVSGSKSKDLTAVLEALNGRRAQMTYNAK